MVSKKTQAILISLLLLLNLIIRIPSVPHEKGYDSFFIHALSNSISINGSADWWVNWLSVFGLYPYSYASAVPFSLSGIAQITGLEMEMSILLFCTVLGLFGIFTSYLFAGEIYNSFLFRLIVAVFFSLAPGVMIYTTWEISARGLFIVMFPFFTYLLLKDDNLLIRKLILLMICFALLFASHHYAYLLIPVFGLYIFLNIIGRFPLNKVKETNLSFLFIFFLFLLIFIPFYNRSFIDSGSRYSWIFDALLTNIRYVGPSLVLAVGGFIYLVFKEKNFNEYMFLAVLVLFSPTIYSHTYGPFFLVFFFVFLVSISFKNLLNMATINNKKFILIFIILIIFASVAFSSYYNHNRTGSSESFWYMSDGTYVAGMWGKEHIPDNSRGLDVAFETSRYFAVSEGHPITPIIGAGSLSYHLIDENYIQFTKNSPFSKSYYFDGPFAVKAGTTYYGKIEWLKQTAKRPSDLSGYKYFVEDKFYYKKVTGVVKLESNKIYDGPRIALWSIPTEKE